MGILPETHKPTLYVHKELNDSYVNELNTDNDKIVSKINMESFAGLGIVDLPGLDADQSHGHEQITKAFLTRLDQILYVTSYIF